MAIPAIYDPKPVAVSFGNASYYWQPQGTSSGERFDPSKMTAAHKTLPLHSVVRVTNLRNSKQAIVRINDRGPYVAGRVIDMSLASAKLIAMTGAGVVPVRIELLQKIDTLSHPNYRMKLKTEFTQPTSPSTPPIPVTKVIATCKVDESPSPTQKVYHSKKESPKKQAPHHKTSEPNSKKTKTSTKSTKTGTSQKNQKTPKSKVKKHSD